MERRPALNVKSDSPSKKSHVTKRKELKLESGSKKGKFLESPFTMEAGLQESFDYTPYTYIFRLSNQILNANINDQPVRCPPFHILLDHTIGVIWSLFSEQRSARSLGINQLYWALSFLKSIIDDDENRPKDVEHCISTLTEEILDMYSDSLDYVIPKYGEGDYKEDRNEELRKTKKLIVKEDIPFSINYADMISRTPLPDEVNQSSSNDTNCKVIRSNTVCGAPQMGRQPCDFLVDMRKSQMSRVMQELEKLQSIEEYMCSCSDCYNSFKPYIDANDKQVNAILAQKINSQNL